MLLQKYFETRLELIEQGLKRFIVPAQGQAVMLKSAMNYAIFSGGKRWRPLLLVSIYEMLSGFKKNKGLGDAVLAAVAVELVHNASIVHDDMPMVMNENERRSNQALHIKYDNTIGILTGDALYTLAFEVLGNLADSEKAVEAIRILSNYSKSYGMIGGQAVDLESKRKMMKINTLRYIDMKKVGSLLQASADIACMLAGADENVRQIMNTYAMNLAITYQMIEDIIADYSRGSEGLDFSDDYVPVSRTSYTALLGFDKARKLAEHTLEESVRMIKPFANNDVLVEFIQMIQERLP
ncbi:MAG: polyprenyl synthetase family protein [Candidatus Cloacimonadaceae bacterium]|nr:polyprenyl synthetase family protein [Candidatus Cloacimonadaceae bacterium]MDP3113187.1 polyprenyl synthetase family protein [Candidatus Cloacimonadaceae bacterium]